MSSAIERVKEAEKTNGVYRQGEITSLGRTTASNRARCDLAKIHPDDFKELYQFHIDKVIDAGESNLVK